MAANLHRKTALVSVVHTLTYAISCMPACMAQYAMHSQQERESVSESEQQERPMSGVMYKNMHYVCRIPELM